MTSNLDRYEKDLDSLIKKGINLQNAIQRECFPEEFKREVQKTLGDEADQFIERLPSFMGEYQAWYSEAKALVRQLLPDRLADFTRYYEKPKSRKEVTFGNYVVEDYLEGLTITRPNGEEIVGTDAAIPRFKQQMSIVEAVKKRFQSSLFDIRQLAQAGPI